MQLPTGRPRGLLDNWSRLRWKSEKHHWRWQCKSPLLSATRYCSDRTSWDCLGWTYWQAKVRYYYLTRRRKEATFLCIRITIRSPRTLKRKWRLFKGYIPLRPVGLNKGHSWKLPERSYIMWGLCTWPLDTCRPTGSTGF